MRENALKVAVGGVIVDKDAHLRQIGLREFFLAEQPEFLSIVCG